MVSSSVSGLLLASIYALSLCLDNAHASSHASRDHLPHLGLSHAAMERFEKSGPGESQSISSEFPVHFFPPLSYSPRPVGVPFPLQDQSAKPWDRQKSTPTSPKAVTQHGKQGQQAQQAQHGQQGQQGKQAQQGVCSMNGIQQQQQQQQQQSAGESGYWYEQIEHNGQSSFLQAEYKDNYKVFRNVVKDFGADNTGNRDASEAIQNAIEAGPSNGPSRKSHSMGSTGQPAIVYLPGGTYRLDKCLQFYLGTVMIGDPTNPPIIQASGNFENDHMIFAKDPNYGGTVNFYIGMKNIVIDSRKIDPNKRIVLLDWTVSQSTQLTNVVFQMPQGAEGHIGLTTEFDYNSNIIINDLKFNGGNIGMNLAGQQWVFKGLTFRGTKTGVVAGGTNIVFLGCTFENGELGIDASGTSGSLTVVDSQGSNMGTLIRSHESGKAANSIVLDNVKNEGASVKLGDNVALYGNVWSTWVHGNLYTPGNPKMEHDNGRTGPTNRAQALLSGKNFFTQKPPTYQEYSANDVLNIKSVQGVPVYGDGVTDDTDSLNMILSMYAGCKVIYFPAGTYIISNTVLVPSGSRLIGDAFATVISGVGDEFMDEKSPTAMVQVGYSGDVGVAQISDFIFSVADVLPGCKMVEVNIAGNSPGEVGFWNSHFRIGGAAGSQVQTKCTGAPCKAAWILLHLTSSSSAYIENTWGWTADHDLDGENKQVIATGRGLLVEATKGTWLIGTGFEHHTLYQYNFQSAQNVFSAMQQSESAYWQGPGNQLAPQPWENSLTELDPHFENCDAGDALCRMGYFEIIDKSSNLFLYGGCNWVFFNNNGDCAGDKCQKNAIQIKDSKAIYLFGTNTKSTQNMVLEESKVIATEDTNAGGWGGVIAAYLYDA